jgi:hypothetical protein
MKSPIGNYMRHVVSRKWFYPLLLVLTWLITIFLVNPIGEFPINDDWAYAKNVFEISVHKKYYVDDWPAMTLVSQTVYGSIVSLLFGFSFTLLRISILLLAIASTVVLYFLLKRRSGNNTVSFLLTSGFSFGQIFCALSFTFMTDIFFLSFVIFSVYSLVCYLDNFKTRNYLFYIFFCLVAVLNRQHGLLLPLLIIFPLLRGTKLNLKKIISALLPFAVCISFHIGYRFVLRVYSPQHRVHGLETFFNTLSAINLSERYLRAGDILMVAGWILIPCSIFLLFAPLASDRRKRITRLIFIFGSVMLVTLPAINHFPLGNVWGVNGIGPKTLKEYFVQSSEHFATPYYLRIIFSVLALISLGVILYHTLFRKKHFFQNEIFSRGFSLAIFFFLATYFVFLVLNESYLDRYVLPLAFFLLVLNVPEIGTLKRGTFFFPGIAVAILFITTVFQVKDFMNWNRTRWKAIGDLNALGINEHFIDGGFEYNAWYKPGKGYETTPDNKSWYWVDRDDFLVSGIKRENYSVKRIYCYRHYLPFTMDTLYVLEKKWLDGSPRP